MFSFFPCVLWHHFWLFQVLTALAKLCFRELDKQWKTEGTHRTWLCNSHCHSQSATLSLTIKLHRLNLKQVIPLHCTIWIRPWSMLPELTIGQGSLWTQISCISEHSSQGWEVWLWLTSEENWERHYWAAWASYPYTQTLFIKQATDWCPSGRYLTLLHCLWHWTYQSVYSPCPLN